MAYQMTAARPEGQTLGQSATDLVGFWGVAGVVQVAGSAWVAVATTAAISASTSATAFGFTSAQATAIITLVNGMRAAGVTTGLWST